MHLYKSRKNIGARDRFEIKEENYEDESRKGTITENYVPREIRRSIHSKREERSDFQRVGKK